MVKVIVVWLAGAIALLAYLAVLGWWRDRKVVRDFIRDAHR